MFDNFCNILFSLFTGLSTDLVETVPPNRKALKRLKIWQYQFYDRSIHSEVFFKKDVNKNSAKFRGKHLCQSLFFNKVATIGLNFIKKETLVQVFSCEFCEIFKNTYFYRRPPVAASYMNNLINSKGLNLFKTLLSIYGGVFLRN